MGEIILVRHGQANSRATTEAEYDRLSDLGHRQAALLGDWMRAHGYAFYHVWSGTLRRHRETVAGMGFEADEDARLNEIDYYKLADDLHRVTGEPHPTGETFGDHSFRVDARSLWGGPRVGAVGPLARQMFVSANIRE